MNSTVISYDTDNFIAGNIHNNISQWENVCSDCDEQSTFMSWIKDKVDVNTFIMKFKGTFNGVFYDHSYPPPRQFKNASNCEMFTDFINSELLSRLQSGAISYLGTVDDITPPHIVSPITIEPSKPRLCINLRYLNCFMKDTPFNLDTLTDVPKIISKDAYMSKLDDKSGYDNVFVTESSKKTNSYILSTIILLLLQNYCKKKRSSTTSLLSVYKIYQIYVNFCLQNTHLVKQIASEIKQRLPVCPWHWWRIRHYTLFFFF